ncbi:hypothetical protein ACHAW5_010068 [Stephanodiscus triporus]|uniref:BZIP domain-containing protein n=1 Tax=Stephanodiscus triporus TaxID=2934178 RepID=A0ABD3QF93_9STRA
MSSSSILPPQVPQAQQSQQPQQQGTPFQQQIQIGLNGQTIPITAVPGANGSIIYQVDPSVVPTSGLRYFTKAINEVSKADDQKEIDPEVLAEKRRQRLARNRESARQSRRRKKEHLASLAAKVQKLQRQLEAEVRSKIRSMEGGLARQRCNMANKWLAEQEKKRSCSASDEHSSGSISSRDSRNQLAMVIDKTSVNCEIRRAVIAHQYHFLRQAFISSHNRYSVWMMLQSSSFFTEASRQQEVALAKTGVAAGSISSGSESASKTASSRANSKQIGEDIFNEDRKRGNGSVICHANDGVRMWPLFCREITMTMDQEDRVINQAHAQAKNTPELLSKLQKMRTATDATHHLQNATLCHTQLTSQRNKMLLLDILTPAQLALFVEWHARNKERCRAVMERRLRTSVAAAAGSGESTVDVVCRQLEKMRLES